MLSGMRPFSHGMVGFYGGVGWALDHSLPGELSKAGYQTQLVGKLHMYPQRKRYGFDNMVWADSQRDNNDYAEWLADNGATSLEMGLAHGVSTNGWVGRPSHLDERFSHTTWCVNEALRFIGQRDPDAPFFLWVSFVDPHPPLTPPLVYWERYESDRPAPALRRRLGAPAGCAASRPQSRCLRHAPPRGRPAPLPRRLLRPRQPRRRPGLAPAQGLPRKRPARRHFRALHQRPRRDAGGPQPLPKDLALRGLDPRPLPRPRSRVDGLHRRPDQ